MVTIPVTGPPGLTARLTRASEGKAMWKTALIALVVVVAVMLAAKHVAPVGGLLK